MEIEPFKIGLSQDQTLVKQLKEWEQNPKSLVFAALADRYRIQGLVRQALEILDEGLAVHPGFGSALVVKARCFFDQRRYADCLGLLHEVLRENPENVRAEKLRAEVYTRLGQRRAALGSLTRTLALVPGDKDTLKALKELQELPKTTKKTNDSLSQFRAGFAPPEPVRDIPSSGKFADFQVTNTQNVAWRNAEANSSTHVAASTAAVAAAPAKPQAEPALAPAPAAEPLEDSLDDSEDEEINPLGGITFATRTVAELYLRQGLVEKAKRILEVMRERSPADPWVQETLEKISPNSVRKSESQSSRLRLMLRARALERMLANVQAASRNG